MPILKIAFTNMLFALAEPEPFTLANLTTKSLIFVIERILEDWITSGMRALLLLC